MALMFQRLARNYIKNGYFPTDGDTTQRVLHHLSVNPDTRGTRLLFDPCCGEGTALAEVAHHLDMQCPDDPCVSYGIEFNQDRFDHAKTLLSTCIKADINDCFIGRQQFGLLWLNPPYGDTVSDNASLSGDKTKRLEKQFFQDTVNSLVFGGVIVLIIPAYSLDKQYANWLIKHFDQLRVYRAPASQFKQVVVMGIKKRVTDHVTSKQIQAVITQGKDLDELPELPMVPEFVYTVPPTVNQNVKLYSLRIDADELHAAHGFTGLWPQFDTTLSNPFKRPRKPLTKMSDWHLALALTSGQVNGRVTSTNGRTLLIKGDSYKVKQTSVETQFDEDGNPREIRTAIDQFVPAITGIDLTDGATFGTVINIK